MLCDCYRSMNKNFMPTATDIAGYCRYVIIMIEFLIKIIKERFQSRIFKK